MNTREDLDIEMLDEDSDDLLPSPQDLDALADDLGDVSESFDDEPMVEEP